MSTETELPQDVIAEIRANRKVSAIKRLRKHTGIDLKEAKELVDAYSARNASQPNHQPQQADTGIGRILILAVGVGIIVGIYKLFT